MMWVIDMVWVDVVVENGPHAAMWPGSVQKRKGSEVGLGVLGGDDATASRLTRTTNCGRSVDVVEWRRWWCK